MMTAHSHAQIRTNFMSQDFSTKSRHRVLTMIAGANNTELPLTERFLFSSLCSLANFYVKVSDSDTFTLQNMLQTEIQ